MRRPGLPLIDFCADAGKGPGWVSRAIRSRFWQSCAPDPRTYAAVERL